MFSPYPTPREGATVVREGGVSRRRPPVNFRPEDAPLFAHEFEGVIPPMRLLELRGVSITPEGCLFKGGRVLPESFSSPVICKQFLDRRSNVLKFFVTNRLLRRRKPHAGRRLWITDDWSYGYFHWLSDVLPRLFAVKELARELVLLLPQQYEQIEFVQSSLKFFKLGGIEYVQPGEIYVCELLVMLTHDAPSGNYDEGLMRGLRELILDACAPRRDMEARGRIYISRARASKRRVANEDEIMRVLEEFGFEVVRFEELTFARQVALASGARYVVSNHGAGLMNMLFMPAGGSVLELRRSGERERNWFFNLAAAARLDYYYQTCEPESPGDDPHTANLSVEPHALRENLALMLDAAERGASAARL
jgi:hypothetical protein